MRHALLLAAVVTVPACGITGNFRLHPGYAGFKSPGMISTSRQVGLSLGPLPLRLARVVFDDDPEVAELLQGLRGVRVYVYDITGRPERVNHRLEEAWTRLIGRGWEPVVTVRDELELTAVLIRASAPEEIAGVAVIVQDRTAVTLVNVLGALRPGMFAPLLGGLGIGVDLDVDAHLEEHLTEHLTEHLDEHP